MNSKPKAPRGPAPTLEIALTGEGIRPQDVSIRHLAEILAATASAIDAVAAERGVAPVQPSLQKIRKGSAVLVLEANDTDTWPEVVTQFYDAAATRGARFGAAVRNAFARLYRSAKIGALQVTAVGLADSKRADPIVMALPLDVAPSFTRFTTTVYGRVVGVNSFDARSVVRMAVRDGGREDFEVTPEGAERAAKFYNRTVRATISAEWDGEKRHASQIDDMQPWEEIDFLGALLEIRDELAREGVQVDGAAWLKELD